MLSLEYEYVRSVIRRPMHATPYTRNYNLFVRRASGETAFFCSRLFGKTRHHCLGSGLSVGGEDSNNFL